MLALYLCCLWLCKNLSKTYRTLQPVSNSSMHVIVMSYAAEAPSQSALFITNINIQCFVIKRFLPIIVLYWSEVVELYTTFIYRLCNLLHYISSFIN